jgi:hypothetical protein
MKIRLNDHEKAINEKKSKWDRLNKAESSWYQIKNSFAWSHIHINHMNEKQQKLSAQ